MPPDATRILVVDDDDDMRLLVRMVVGQAAGIEVVADASDAETALAAWRGTGPDVVVLDYLIPGRNGLEVAREMLATDPEQPIILFSANLDPATMLAADAIGVCEVLGKDRVRELPDLIRRWAGWAGRPSEG